MNGDESITTNTTTGIDLSVNLSINTAQRRCQGDTGYDVSPT